MTGLIMFAAALVHNKREKPPALDSKHTSKWDNTTIHLHQMF